ncbi:MAG TPA: IS4 family transposase [Candidatus Saccharimonadales bacterium]|nr:IS4 family transposase [Candidatus Saccharimonadales bacterium]
MGKTPFFPAWRARLAPLQAAVQAVRSQPLPHLQGLFGPWIPQEALAREKQGPGSRHRVFPLELTFWAFLGQILNPGASCREAVRQVLALFCLAGKDAVDEQTSGYCQARQRLPLPRLQQILGRIAQGTRRACPKARLWRGREIKVVDGSTATMADTPAHQKVFPQQRMQKPGCGFPIMRLVGLFSLTTGCLVGVVTGSYYDAELSLFRRLWHFLKPRDVLLADRHFSDYGTLACLWNWGVDAVMRMNQARPKDFRQGHYLGPGDRLITWKKPAQRTRTLGARLWASLPEVLTLRMIRVRCAAKGFRTRELVLVTTLLDPEKYPAAEIAQLFLQRWSVELFFGDLKTILKMEHLRCQSPAMVQKEFFMHLIGDNLIRALMLQSARRHDAPLERLSFKGSVDAVRHDSAALAQAKTKTKAAQLAKELLRVLAADLVPDRPGRREPRAVKRRPKPYSLLTKPRHQFVEIPHRGKYRAAA